MSTADPPALPRVRGRRPRARGVAALASAAVLLTSGVAWAGVSRFTGGIDQIALGLSHDVRSGPVTILLVASDNRGGLTDQQKRDLHLGTGAYGAHTDTMMLAHISSDNKVSVVSLPRDTLVDIAAYRDTRGKEHRAHRGKLNEVYADGGARMMIATVDRLTGLTVDHYAEIDFAGFLSVVDAVDGVEVCLPTALKDQKSGLDLPAGRQSIRGKQALAYVRARYVDPTADLGRMARQQRFVAAIARKALTAGVLLNPARLDALLRATSSSLTTDDGLGRDQLLDLAGRLQAVKPADISFTTVPIGATRRVPGVGAVLTWDAKRSSALFTALRDDRPATSAPSVPARSTIAVTVANGTSIPGLATRAATDIAAAGFSVVGAPGDSSEQVGSRSLIRYDPAQDGIRRTLVAAFPGARLVPAPGTGNAVSMIVGTGYRPPAARVTRVGAATSAASDACG